MVLSMPHSIVEGIAVASFFYSLMFLHENPRFGIPRSDDGGAFSAALPVDGIIFGATTG
jgi:hypothetical protein